MGKKIEICGLNTSSIRRLSAKESFSLLEKIKQGDEKAREFFITANVRLVLSLVKRFDKGKASGDDLFQAGMIGLIKSVDNFDLSVGVRFSTYAVPMIIGELKRVMRANNGLRVPRSVRDTAYRVLQTRSVFGKPTIPSFILSFTCSKILKLSGFSPFYVILLHNLSCKFLSCIKLFSAMLAKGA